MSSLDVKMLYLNSVSPERKRKKEGARVITTRKNLSAFVAILLGILIVSLAVGVGKTGNQTKAVYSQLHIK